MHDLAKRTKEGAQLNFLVVRKIALFLGWAYPEMLRVYFWLSAQESLLIGLEDHKGFPELNLSQLCERQLHYPQCYHSGPRAGAHCFIPGNAQGV